MKPRLLPLLSLMVLLMVVGQPSPCVADRCPTCQGTRTISCPQCRGTGIAEWTTIHGQRAAYGCERCGGVRGDPMHGTGRPGRGRIACPTCGGTGEVASPQSPAATPPTFTDTALEQQRALEERRQQELAAAKRKQEEFEKTKQALVQTLQGINPGADLELKGTGETRTGGLPLKGVDESSTAVVDLRHLDPSKPIVVDPEVVRGVSETLKNANYNAGFEALKRSDYASAVRYFEQAQQERPEDRFVRNALLLAQDLVKVHQKTKPLTDDAEQNRKAQHHAATSLTLISRGDYDGAVRILKESLAMSPNDRNIADTLSFVEGMAVEQANWRKQQPNQRSNRP